LFIVQVFISNLLHLLLKVSSVLALKLPEQLSLLKAMRLKALIASFSELTLVGLHVFSADLTFILLPFFLFFLSRIWIERFSYLDSNFFSVTNLNLLLKLFKLVLPDLIY
jgi:hypothetical protein